MLSKLEKETIIIFNEEEPTAIIGTYNEKLKRRLRDFESSSNDCSLVKSNEGYVEYTVPKKWIKVNMPKRYSEEQKQKMAERARLNLLGKMRSNNND